MTDLKPCPFCGGEAELRHNRTWDYEVRCTNCRAKTRLHHDNHVGAVDDWNARAERTCRMEYQTDGMQRGWWKCSECGKAMDTIEACGGRKPPKFCGNCGAEVVDR